MRLTQSGDVEIVESKPALGDFEVDHVRGFFFNDTLSIFKGKD